MFRVSVLYPLREGAHFDHDYYANRHIPMVKDKLGAALVRAEIDRGVGGGQPGEAPPFVAIGHLIVRTLEEFQQGMAAHGAEIMGDVPNYTDLQPQIQVSAIVE